MHRRETTQIQTDIPDTSADVARLPRWLPLVGIAIGLAFWGFIMMADFVLGALPKPLQIEMHKIAFDGAVADVDCALADQPGARLHSKVFSTTIGQRSDVVSIQVLDAVPNAVLSIGSVPDVAGLLPCRNGAPAGEIQWVGDTLAFSGRHVQTFLAAFALDDPDPDTTYLLMVDQPAAISFRIEAFLPEDHVKTARQQLLLHVAFSSAIAFMVLYNLALSVLARMPTFLFNALTVSSMLVLNLYLTGIGSAYLWPQTPSVSNAIVVLALAGPTLFAPFYIYRFVVPPDVPILRARPLLLGWPIAALLVIASTAIVPYYVATIALVGMWIAFAIVAIWHLLRASQAGHAAAKIMLLAALGAVLPGMALSAAKDFAGVEFGAMVPHLTELSILLEALLFTLVLAYQIRLSRWRELDALRDINKQADFAKRDLLATIDSDRTRLASDLHDSTGQMLGLISSRLKRTAQSDEIPDASRADITQTAGMIGDTLDEIRRMAHDLHPATLVHLGLTKAIESLCQHMSGPGGIRFECDLEFDATHLSSGQQLQVYRIVQELMTNAAKHSGASDARLALRSRQGKFHLQFSDNGQMTPYQPGQGIGQTILQQRIASLNGTLERRSSELGTTIEMAFETTPSKGQG